MSLVYQKAAWHGGGALDAPALHEIVTHRGPVLSPITPILEAVRKAGTVATTARSYSGVDAPGLTIWLGEGAWSFGPAGITISRHNIRIVGCGRRTVLYRTSTATGPLVTLAGDNCWLEHLRVIDSAGSQSAFAVTGDRCGIDSVWFEDCWRAVTATGANRIRVARCNVEAVRDGDYSILLTGTINTAIVTENHCPDDGQTANIYFDDDVDRGVATGNVCGSPISYLGAATAMAISNTANSASAVTAR